MTTSRSAGISPRLPERVARRLPGSIKRRLRRTIPQRYWHHFDREWHRHTMGGRAEWERLGKAQFDFLIEVGLRPHHYLLDVGCGPLRAGVHLIDYLEPGHYFGVDRRGDKLESAARSELPRYGLVDKRPVLGEMADFGFERLGQKFDYALAQSVFTHLPLNSIIRCLMNIDRVLVTGGRFYATIFVNEQGKWNLEPIRQGARALSHFDTNPFHYDFATFEWICEGTGLTPEYWGDWQTPKNQKMIAFTKT